MGIGEGLTGNCTPALEPFAPGADHSHARFYTVGDNQRSIGRKERGDLDLIRLKLMECGPDGGLLVGSVLEFNDHKRQTVDKQHHVGAAGRGGFQTCPYGLTAGRGRLETSRVDGGSGQIGNQPG